MGQRILKHKKLIIFLVIYLVFLGWILHAFSGSPPGNTIEVYKSSSSTFLTNARAQEMKECGVNTYRFTPGVFMDSQGNIHELPFMKQITIWQIQTAHRNGLQVYFDLKNNYGPLWEAMLGQASWNIPETVWPTFFPQYNKKVLERADIAERYGVELFNPMAEAEGMIGQNIYRERGSFAGYDKASEWGQEILPKIRERYHGKVIWRGSIGPPILPPGTPDAEQRFWRDWERIRNEAYINFTGYDYIGFTAWPDMMPPGAGPEDYRRFIREVIDTTTKWAERDGCQDVMCTELDLGRWLYSRSIVFEEGEGRLKGYDTWLQTGKYRAETRYWYKERLP